MAEQPERMTFLCRPIGRWLICILLLSVGAFVYPLVGVAVMNIHHSKGPYNLVYRHFLGDLCLSNLVGFSVAFAFFLGGFVLTLLKCRETECVKESTEILLTAVVFMPAVGYFVSGIGLMVHRGNLPIVFTVETVMIASAIGMGIVVGGVILLLIIASFLCPNIFGLSAPAKEEGEREGEESEEEEEDG